MTSERGPVLLSCLGVATDLPLLPHFLKHYRDLGVAPRDMHLILNAPDEGQPELEEAREVLDALGCATPDIWIGAYTSRAMWDRRTDLQQKVAKPDDWVLSADVDEFHEYPEPLADFLDRCERLGVDCAQGVFIDRLAQGGELRAVHAAPPILEQFPVRAEVAFSLAGTGRSHGITGTVKIMAMRGHVRPGIGGHGPLAGHPVQPLYVLPLGHIAGLERPTLRFDVPTRVHHVHWTDSLPARLKTRLNTPGVSPAGREYGQKQLDHIARHQGIGLHTVAVEPNPTNAPWLDRLHRLRRKARWQQVRSTPRRVLSRVLGR